MNTPRPPTRPVTQLQLDRVLLFLDQLAKRGVNYAAHMAATIRAQPDLERQRYVLGDLYSDVHMIFTGVAMCVKSPADAQRAIAALSSLEVRQ